MTQSKDQNQVFHFLLLYGYLCSAGITQEIKAIYQSEKSKHFLKIYLHTLKGSG